jgi:DNA-binding response OmpR family regulator
MKNKVLIIEDELDLQENLKDILEFNNLEVWTAVDGEDALIIIENTAFDLIISDILMPRLDGISFLSEIKLRKGFENIPFILLSGKSSREDQRYGIEQGADDYLVKPVSSRILLNAVFSNLEKRKKREDWAQFKLENALKEDRKIIFHEFRTPLTGVLSVFELMESMLDNKDEHEFRELIQIGKQSANRITESLNKLSIFNRLDHLSVSISDFKFDQDLLKKISKGNYSRITISSWSSEKLISLDFNLFNFLIKELIDNAVKFSIFNSPIYLSYDAGLFTLTNLQNISSEIAVYEPKPFSQINRITVEQQGLGLGLFICKRIASLHNIFFKCEIQLDFTFKVTVDFQSSIRQDLVLA